MRICFVGNSHLATAKFGWDAVAAEYPGVEASFFGAIASIFTSTAIEDGKLVAKSEEAKQYFIRTSGGRDTVVFAEYDLVVLFALGFGLWCLLDYYDRFRWGDQNNSEGDYELVSTGYFHEIVRTRLSRSTAIQYRREIRRDSGSHAPKVWIYPEPMPSRSVLAAAPAQKSALSTQRLSALRQAAKWHDEKSLGDAFSAGSAALSRSEDVIFEQPAHTLDTPIFTQQEYSRGSISLGNLPDREDDFVHMNARFGELMIRQILERATG